MVETRLRSFVDGLSLQCKVNHQQATVIITVSLYVQQVANVVVFNHKDRATRVSSRVSSCAQGPKGLRHRHKQLISILFPSYLFSIGIDPRTSFLVDFLTYYNR